MRSSLAFVGLGLWGVIAANTVSCGSDDDNNAGGKGGSGTILEGGSGTGGTGGAAGSGGSAGTGGGTANRLGAACEADTDCGEGLTCITADSATFDGKGPARGYCSADCSGDAGTCAQYGEDSVCLTVDSIAGTAMCMRGCTFGGDAPNPNKCRGRREVACAPLFGGTDTACTTDAQCRPGEICGENEDGTSTCFQVVPACLPQCNADSECGTGLFCDPADGLCSATPKAGKALGAKCAEPDGGVDECRGNCIGLVASAGSDPLTTLCAETCILGVAPPTCGWTGPASPTPAPGYCLLASSIYDALGGAGIGDRGSCAKLCNCNADCAAQNPDLICSALLNAPQLVQATKQRGYCTLPILEDGGVDPGLPSCSTGGTGGAGGTAGTGGTAGAAGTGGTAGADGG